MLFRLNGILRTNLPMGPAGGGHPPGKDHPSWKHGMRSQEWIEARAEINELVREAREIERMVSDGAV